MSEDSVVELAQVGALLTRNRSIPGEQSVKLDSSDESTGDNAAGGHVVSGYQTCNELRLFEEGIS